MRHYPPSGHHSQIVQYMYHSLSYIKLTFLIIAVTLILPLLSIYQHKSEIKSIEPVRIKGEEIIYEKKTSSNSIHQLGTSKKITQELGLISLENPLLLHKTPSQKIILSAKEATYQEKSPHKLVYLYDNILVIIHKQNTPPIFITTSSLVIDLESQSFKSDQDTFSIQSKLVTQSPNGFELHPDQSLSFGDNTTLTLLNT